MKKYIRGKKILVFCLAAASAVMLHAVFLPGEVSAEGAEVSESAEGQVSENIAAAPAGKNEPVSEEGTADLSEQAECSLEVLPASEGGGAGADSDEDYSTFGNTVSGDVAADKNASENQGETAVYPILILVESGSSQYDQLSAFLALSADKFQIYMVTFVDGEGNPAQPDGAVQVAAEIPADYDMTRTVISEISLEGDVPRRTELSYTAVDGKAVFQTDHAGMFAVMVKKDQPQLPPSLEMTDKVERLELNKQTGTAGNVTGNRSFSSVPKTGDQAASFLWLGVSAAVSAGLLLTVIANSTKNSKKS